MQFATRQCIGDGCSSIQLIPYIGKIAEAEIIYKVNKKVGEYICNTCLTNINVNIILKDLVE